MTDDEDVLGWLDDGDGDDGGGGGAADGGADEEFQDALDWLKDDDGDESGGETIQVKAEDASGLDWLEGDDTAPALTEDDEPEEASQSIFSEALDDFVTGLEEKAPAKKDVAEGDKTIVTSRGRSRVRRRPGADQRVDKVMNTLIRYLTRKEPVRESQLDTIFRLTVGKIVDPLSAEVIIVYFLDGQGNAHFAHLFYSKQLFRNHPGLEGRFNSSLEQLGQLSIPAGSGIVGRAISGKKSITSLDARNDMDFQNHLGKATGYGVKTMLTVPIRDEDEVYGAIQVMNKDPHCGEEFFSFQDLKLIEEVAAYLGRLIHIIREPGLERTSDEIAGYYAKLAKTELVDLTSDDFYWDDRLWEVVGVEVIKKYHILPVKKLDSKSLQVVMTNPLDHNRRHNFEAATELHIGDALVATESQIKEVLSSRLKVDTSVAEGEFAELAGEIVGGTEQVDIDEGEEESGPIIKLANRIIEDAFARGASDIHIEPYETYARVRYRVDGTLSERMRFPIKALSALISRIKIMSNLDIAERRLPQDGKIKFKRFSRKKLDIDLRVATGPMAFGEKCVMRLLVKGSISLGLDAMGFAAENLKKYRWACNQPYGMILNVGPTGSGKTTTLYSGLTEVNDVAVNIQTAEDPIEYPLEGINQMQMHKDIGLTFASALKCYLRMDPDIILVGEIRDLETAEIGIEASLTGHLLFSTLHTNDAAGTVTRFLEMGIEPFMVSSSLLVCCAQRLLKRTCDKCRVEWEPTAEELEILNWDPRQLQGPMYMHADTRKSRKPCPKCGGSGYKGRVGTHEVLSMDDDLRALTVQRAPANLIKAQAMRNGMLTIFQDALFKVKEGVTDLPDIIARVKADEKPKPGETERLAAAMSGSGGKGTKRH
jgi:type IV pilus assembly protein PilB